MLPIQRIPGGPQTNRAIASARAAQLTIVNRSERNTLPGTCIVRKEDGILQQIAERLQLTAAAHGAAIAVKQNGKIVCRASSGPCAPAIDVVLDCELGLSGLCFRSGKTVRCDDTGCDSGHHCSIARDLGIASVLVVPIREGDEISGFVEVLSRTPNAFHGSIEEVVNSAAATVGTIIGAAHHRRTGPLKGRSVYLRKSAVRGTIAIIVIAGLGAGVSRVAVRNVSGHVAPMFQASSFELLPIESLRGAAMEGDAAAEYELAMRYSNGRGVARNQADSVWWLLKSAHAGNNRAQHQLGIAYEQGDGIQQDYVKAYACYVMAGANGNIDAEAARTELTPKLTRAELEGARMLIARMYKEGVGTPVNNEEAYAWFTLAQAGGNRDIEAEKSFVASKMSSRQIAIANQRASELGKSSH